MNLNAQRDLFTLPQDVHYLNCATFGPLNIHSERAGKQALEIGKNPLLRTRNSFFEPVEQTKALFAQLIGAATENIAIIPSVSYGIATVAHNISLTAKHEVLLLQDQFPSNYFTWQKACELSGAKLKIVEAPSTPAKSKDWTEAIIDHINPKTRVVTMGQVHWMDGTYFDLKQIKERCLQVGAYLIIDGTQSVGALPFDTSKIKPDALIVAGYKWMLGTYGLGYAYFGERLLDGQPIEENWINRDGSENFENLTQYSTRYKPGAARYSMGEQSSFISIAIANEALRLILKWRPERIQNYAKELTKEPWKLLLDAGVEMDLDNPSHHLVGLRLGKHWDMISLRNQLQEHKIVVSQRGDALRVSINVFNEKSDLDSLVETILQMRK